MTTEHAAYQPKDAISVTLTDTAFTGGVGLMMSAVSNALARSNVGAMGVFTRTGSTIGYFAAMGGLYGFTRTASANLRHKDDAWNAAVGGFFGGATMALRLRTIPSVLGYGTAAAVTLGTFEYLGGSLSGPPREPEKDVFAERERLRKNRRRPIQETIDDIGERRGIKAPGYEERRRERLKAKYGIDIPSKEI